MKLKKALAVTLAATMAVAGLAGCGAKDDTKETTTKAAATEPKKVELTVWGPQEDQAPVDGYSEGILKSMCDSFAKAHPEWDITFEYGVCSEGDAKDVVTKDVAAAADVYHFANDQIPTLVQANALAKLGGSIADSIKETNEDTMVNSVTYEDGLYGAPFSPNTWFMYYDTSKFSEEEVKSLDTMMAKDLGKGVSNFSFPLDNSWYIASFYYAAGGTLFGADGSDVAAGCTFDDENGVAVTNYLVDLAASDKFTVEKNGSSIAKFKEGKLGAYCTGNWDGAAIKEALGNNFGVTIIPSITINGTDGQMKSFAGSKAVGYNPSTKYPEVAAALAAYLGDKECQEIRFNTRNITPTNKEVAASDAVKNDVVATALADEIASASVVQPMIPEMGSYWTPAETMGKEIVQGDVNKDNAKAKTEAMVKGILSYGM